MRIENLCLDPSAAKNHAGWRTQGVQDPTTGLWTYSIKEDADGETGTCLIFGSTVEYDVPYVAVVDFATPIVGNVAIGRFDTNLGTKITATDTKIVYRIVVPNANGNSPQVYLWLQSRDTVVTPKRVGLYTVDDWNALQSQNLTWFDKTNYPLFKQ
ncbi:hypothetical protein KIH79_07625 [Bifidobacterium sp. 82T10]|uniref:Uncharacterized protein n=1 Tax=Bifidobacterium miconis TaxID=2834435 RepID=A0ABS6WFG9_9BIFI|nr:hypothetical protein [Bifidobacterium miconis]MBW3092799.1 hypothetical protein [Bifidobacterium miconis]